MPRPFGERYRFVIVLGLLFFKCDSEMQEFWCVTFNDDSDTDRMSRALCEKLLVALLFKIFPEY